MHANDNDHHPSTTPNEWMNKDRFFSSFSPTLSITTFKVHIFHSSKMAWSKTLMHSRKIAKKRETEAFFFTKKRHTNNSFNDINLHKNCRKPTLNVHSHSPRTQTVWIAFIFHDYSLSSSSSFLLPFFRRWHFHSNVSHVDATWKLVNSFDVPVLETTLTTVTWVFHMHKSKI